MIFGCEISDFDKKKRGPNFTKRCLKQTVLSLSFQNVAADVTRDNMKWSIMIWCFLASFSSLTKSSQRKLGAFDENLEYFFRGQACSEDRPWQCVAPAHFPPIFLPFSVAELPAVSPATQTHFHGGKRWAEQALGYLSCRYPQRRAEMIPKAELARMRNFPSLILNEWFFCFVGNLSWNFFIQCPELDIFRLLSLISIPEVWREIKISETEGFFWFVTLKIFQLGISASSALRPSGFPGNTPAHLPKASC